jgi:hypothetical protein
MAHDVRIIRVGDFLEILPEGDYNLEQSLEALMAVAAIPGAFTEYDIFLDTRHAHTHLSEADLWYLAQTLARLPRDGSAKIAILCPAERFDHARFFELCSSNRGVNVTAFTSFEQAIDWLSGPRKAD